jgi:histidine ammonia-lyase
MSSANVNLTSDGASFSDVIAVARDHATVVLSGDAVEAIVRSRERVDGLVDRGEPVYGVTTGFGALAHTLIPADKRTELQRALLLSHAAGMGDPVEREVVRAMMFLRARTLARGYSGVSLGVVEQIVALLNADVYPVVPEHGSLGASGDLAPLAHVGIVLIGEGLVHTATGTESARETLQRIGRQPVELGAKDGLALINGTDGILGMLVMAIADIERLLKTAEVAAAMTVEGLLGTTRPFASELQALRPQVGQADSAANLVTLLAESPIVASHRHDDPRVQDAYSVRCTPQVIGAARDTLAFARTTAERELASAIDNPVVLDDGRIESCGNFHGAPLAYACDFLAIVLADVSALVERRLDRMLDAVRSEGLPAFLAPDAGVNSGMMIAHYTAAAIVAVNRRLAVPASADTLPTSASQEDHVSMGWSAARKLRVVIGNLARVIAVELVAASHAIDFRRPIEPAAATSAVVGLIRGHVDEAGADRFLALDLAAVENLVVSGEILDAAESIVGPLR